MTGNLTTFSGNSQQPTAAVLVIGGGISGMQSALDLANAGIKVYLVEGSPAIGGKMAQLDKTFPTNDCSMCIVSPKLVEVGRHRNIKLFTHSEVKEPDRGCRKFHRHRGQARPLCRCRHLYRLRPLRDCLPGHPDLLLPGAAGGGRKTDPGAGQGKKDHQGARSAAADECRTNGLSPSMRRPAGCAAAVSRPACRGR